MLRIRRFDDLCDLEKPMETYSYKEYSSLEDNIKENVIIKAGKNYLNQGNLNKNTDINFTRAYGMQSSKIDLKKRLSIPKVKPSSLSIFNYWYDFPHAYGMKNFTDFLDWTNSTLKIAKKEKI